MNDPAEGNSKWQGSSRRLLAVAMVVLVAVGGYFLATYSTSGDGRSPSGTGSQSTGPTSAIRTISTIVDQKGTVALKSYDWADFNNLTMIILDNGSVPFVINTVDFSGSGLGTGTPAKSVSVTALAGGCTPTGSSPPFTLPISCNSGESVTISVAPPANLSPCSGSGVFLIVTVGGTQQFISLDVTAGGSSANPNATPPQDCATSTPLVGYFAGNMAPNSKSVMNLAPLQGERYVEINLSSSGVLNMRLLNSSTTVYTVSGQSGTYTYCVPVAGNYELGLYNPGPNVNTVFVYVYELTNGPCTPAGR